MVDPVVEKVLVMEAYAVLAVVLYLQVAGSLVVTPRVTEPVGCVPIGRPAERVGGVVSQGGSNAV